MSIRRSSSVRSLQFLLALLFVPAAAAQDYEATEVADGVYRFRWNNHVGMFLDASGDVVVFDPINPDAAAVLAQEIHRIVPEANLAAIVYSHSDTDHASGAAVLREAFDTPDAPIIAQENAVAAIRTNANPDQIEPTVTFAERMAFHVNGRRIELHYLGVSHTDNIAVPFIPDAGVAFAVDFANNDRVGYQDLPGWQFPEFFEALSGLLRIPFDTMVFGHGPVGDRATIQRQIAYYDDLTSAVRQALADGLSEDEMAAHIALPDYAHWDQYEAWMPLNARAIYRWLAESGE
jgi:glyoxylase-like metal-dependent hydrolase (beta-lactamase superfamily II)